MMIDRLRILCAAGVLLGLGALGGCQQIKNSPPESLSPTTMQVDEAMQIRDWDRQSALYANGSTVAGPIGFLYAPRQDASSPHKYGLTETPLFLINTALLPYAFYKTTPLTPVEWRGATIEPTYTGNPPLPPE